METLFFLAYIGITGRVGYEPNLKIGTEVETDPLRFRFDSWSTCIGYGQLGLDRLLLGRFGSVSQFSGFSAHPFLPSAQSSRLSGASGGQVVRTQRLTKFQFVQNRMAFTPIYEGAETQSKSTCEGEKKQSKRAKTREELRSGENSDWYSPKMEVSFHEHELYTSLTPEEKISFYHRMKQVVVYVSCALDEGGPVSITGGGVVLSRSGYVITAASVISKNKTDISFCLHDGEQIEADVVEVDYSLNLAVLKPKSEFEGRVFDYATFGDVSKCTVGSSAVTIRHRIVHPRDIAQSVLIGYLAFEANDISQIGRYRTVGQVTSHSNDPKYAEYDKDLNVMQIANFHDAAAGAAVFDSQGRVVGVLAFPLHGFYFAVHLDVVQRFYEKVISDEESEV